MIRSLRNENQKLSPSGYPYEGRRISFRRPMIMGIVNVTPDSFSDGGKYSSKKSAVAQAEELIKDGADIIDVGGESTRPFSSPVTADEEVRRVVPVIEELSQKYRKIPISIDSYKPAVVQAAIESGASIVNDITGLRDLEMLKLTAKHNIPVVITHMKGDSPKTMQLKPRYKDVTKEIALFFKERIRTCKKAGIGKIILDPGIGFGKSADHNLAILRDLEILTKLGFPVMVGTSRKSFIGKILSADIGEREEGTIASNVLSVYNGASIVRVHDVKKSLCALKVAFSVMKGKATIKW